MADTSLLPVIVGGALALAGTLATAGVTIVRDAVQQRREMQKRRADKFEELVATVYEFDCWMARVVFHPTSKDVLQTVSPFSKVQSIASVYFPRFIGLVHALDRAADNVRMEKVHYQGSSDRNAKVVEEARCAYEQALSAYIDARDELLKVLQNFACNESFNGLYGKKSIVER
jgi:hypothetical protein